MARAKKPNSHTSSSGPKYKIGDIVYPQKPKNNQQYLWNIEMDQYHNRRCEITEVNHSTTYGQTYRLKMLDLPNHIYNYIFKESWLSVDETGKNLSSSQREKNKQLQEIIQILEEE